MPCEMTVLVRLIRRAPLLCYFSLAYVASGLALAVIGWPTVEPNGGHNAAALAVFPMIIIAVSLAGLALTAATDLAY